MLVAAALLLAQTALCTATDVALPSDLAGWVASPGSSLVPGVPYLSNTIDPAAPSPIAPMAGEERPRGRSTKFMFTVKAPGIYRIALDQPGWIDVQPVSGAKLASVKHGHGPECSSIRKIVGFKLDAGAHYLTLTKLTKPQIKVMLIAD